MELIITEEEKRQDPRQVFQLLDKFGEGSYGSVYKAKHIRTGVICAIKQIPVEKDLNDTIKEINIMTSFSSDYLVKFYASYLTEESLWIVMEICLAGSVSDVMKLCDTCLTESMIASVCFDVLNGLLYIHEKRKIHRDIKAANILLNQHGSAKLADFGVAGHLSDHAAKRVTVIGTPFWMAPEVIQEVGYGTGADIWSLGITCIEMAEGRPPYYDTHPMRAIFMIPANPPPTLSDRTGFSDALVDFIRQCLLKNPATRPSAKELLDHPFIATRNQDRNPLLQLVKEAIEKIGMGYLRQAESDADTGTESIAEDDLNESRSSNIVFDMSASMSRNYDHEDDTMKPEDFAEYTFGSKQQISADDTIKISNLKISNAGPSSVPQKSKPQIPNKAGYSKRDWEDYFDSLAPKELRQLLQLVERNQEKELKSIHNEFAPRIEPITEALLYNPD